MKTILKKIAQLFAALLIGAAALAAHTWFFKPISIDWFYSKLFFQFAIESPELLTQLRLFEQIGIRGHNGQWGDASEANADKQFVKLKADFETFKAYDASALKGQEKVSYEVLDFYLKDKVNGEPWRFHNLPISQHFGAQTTTPELMTQSQQINDATDAEHYISRLETMPLKFDQILEGVKIRESKGILPMRFVLDKVVTQLQNYVAKGAKETSLYTAFKDKLDKLPEAKMQAAEKTRFLARAEAAIQTKVIPNFKKITAHFESLKSKVSTNDGVWSWPNGEQYYQYCIETNTTTKLTANELHTIGLAEVERLKVQMISILDTAGYSEGNIAQRVKKLSDSPSQQFSDDDAGRAQILKDYQTIIDEIDGGLAPYFSVRPRAKVEVKRVEPSAEASSAGAYYQPAPLDGSMPGRFYANLRDVKETPKFGMRTLAYHEAIPGHHFQIGIAQELKGLPIFRNVLSFTAYAEGWALYSEKLAAELGFQKNPLDNLGRLQAEMFRAVRLVVDTGIHSKRWTRERAIDYMVEHTGMSATEVETEIERYFVDPGQALAYKVGMLKILELRERAKTELGPKFDIKEFHTVVLANGSLPLAVLEGLVNDMISKAKASKP
jgi:uncharacterized protein (DUF885 family)